MNHVPAYHLYLRRQLRWPEMLAWGLLLLPMVALGLQFNAPQRSTVWIMSLDVCVFGGCALIFSASILHSAGRYRLSTICCTISMLGSALIQLLAIAVAVGSVRYEQISSIQAVCIVAAYLLGMLAIALTFL